MITQRALPSFHSLSWHRHVVAKNQVFHKRCYASDPYRTLNLKQGASKEEIKAAYVELSKKYHPDLNKDPGASEKFMKVKEAAEMLLNKDGKTAKEQSRYSQEDMYRRHKFQENLRRRQRMWEEDEKVRRHRQQHDNFWRDYYKNKQHIDNEEFWRQYYKQRDEWYGSTRNYFDAEARSKEWKKYYENSQQKRQQHFAERNERIRRTMEDHRNERIRRTMEDHRNARENETKSSDTHNSDRHTRFYTFYKEVRQEDYDRFFDENGRPNFNFFKYLIGFFGIQLLIFYVMTKHHDIQTYSGKKRDLVRNESKQVNSKTENINTVETDSQKS